MNAPAKLAAFAAALAVIFALAFGAGAALGGAEPDDRPTTPTHEEHTK